MIGPTLNAQQEDAALLGARQTEPVSEPPFRPIGHIGKAGSRVGLCGAEILGIPAFGEYDLCPVCRELHGGDPRDLRRTAGGPQGPS